MVAHRARDANAADRAGCLKPGRDVDAIAMNIGALGKHVADIDPDPKADALARRKIAVELRHPPLHLDRALHGRSDAGELDQECIPGGVDEAAAMLAQLGIDKVAADHPDAVERARIVAADMPAVPCNIGVDDRDQLAGTGRFRRGFGLAGGVHRIAALCALVPGIARQRQSDSDIHHNG